MSVPMPNDNRVAVGVESRRRDEGLRVEVETWTLAWLEWLMGGMIGIIAGISVIGNNWEGVYPVLHPVSEQAGQY